MAKTQGAKHRATEQKLAESGKATEPAARSSAT